MKNILIIFLLPLIVISIIPACSENDYQESRSDETGSISFNVEWIGAPSLIEEQRVYTRALNCPESKIDTVTFEIRDENDNLLEDKSWDCERHEGIVSGIPAGTDRKLIVEGKDDQDRVRYRGEIEGIVVTAGELTDVQTVVCDPIEIIEYAFLQYRTYQDANPKYRGWIEFFKEDNPIDMSGDISQIVLRNSSGNIVVIGSVNFYSDSHYKGTWNDLTSSVEYSGPYSYTGLGIGFPVGTFLPSGYYTYEITTIQEESLSITLYFPMETIVPTISDADMYWEWRIDNSLYLSWTGPAGDFDELKIVLTSQDYQDLLYVTLPPDVNELTVPSGIIQNITDLKTPNGANWAIQTRYFTTTIDENNYARGYSSVINIPWQP